MFATFLSPGSLTVESVAPPGWESTVKRMKRHTDISNPFALAWYMKKHGARPHKKKAKAAAAAEIIVDAEDELADADDEFWKKIHDAELHLAGQIPDVFVKAAQGDGLAQSYCLAHTPYRVG